MPSQDIVLGIYYLSQFKDNEKEKPKGIFLNVDEINNALERKGLLVFTQKLFPNFLLSIKREKK